MNLQEYVKLLRSRWVTVCVTILVTLTAAVVLSLLTTPMYQASTRLFVSTAAGANLAETYQGNRSSQERVYSYTELLTGRTLAQRTIDKLDLGMTADELRDNITASAKPDTVLIDVDVLDSSPVQARDIANALSDEFVTLVRELETPEDGSAPDTRVIVEQSATIPAEPIIPNTTRNVGIGLALGLILGLGLALARHLLDNTVKDRESVEQLTGVGLVGSIPLDKERRKETPITFATDNSAIAESFRKIRTNLQFVAVDNPPRVIVLTSSVPTEGKSTTAINVALALAENGHNVALIDGDMRRPTLHKYLNLVGPVGFSTVLSRGATLEQTLQKSRFPGLTVLTAGTVPPNPSELLASQSAKNVIDELRERFDYVIIDSTPLLAVTDAAILAAVADGVLLIARYGHTKREQLAHAASNLTDVGAPLLGAVLTMVPTRSNASYSYNYYYYYGEGSAKSTSSSRHNRRRTSSNEPSA